MKGSEVVGISQILENIETSCGGKFFAVGGHPLAEYFEGTINWPKNSKFYCDSFIGWVYLWRRGVDCSRSPGPSIFEYVMNYQFTDPKKFFVVGGDQHDKEFLGKWFVVNKRPVYLLIHEIGVITSQNFTEIEDRILDAKPDVVFVCLGCPKQDLFLSRISLPESAVGICVGAALPFFSGRIKRAPDWFSRFALEWFWRFLTEPSRMRPRLLKIVKLLARPRFWIER